MRATSAYTDSNFPAGEKEAGKKHPQEYCLIAKKRKIFKWGDLLKRNKQEQLIGIYAGRQHTNHMENNKHSQHHHKNQTLHRDGKRNSSPGQKSSQSAWCGMSGGRGRTLVSSPQQRGTPQTLGGARAGSGSNPRFLGGMHPPLPGSALGTVRHLLGASMQRKVSVVSFMKNLALDFCFPGELLLSVV